ncbi:response regulator [Uliginosibacterium sp. sgz301328]|uniref:response regulator transcription factor n=1 Tax=Uliginosibacterium sp. sgz301328 TaxID=3243764 RepID=UPI00359DBE58
MQHHSLNDFLGNAASRKRKVLLVDPQPMILLGLKMTIDEESSLECVGVAQNAETALQIAAECHPDLVVVDYELPDMPGLEFIRKIVQMPWQPNVLVLTGAIRPVSTTAIANSGAKGFLNKVADIPTIRTTMNLVANGFTCLPQWATERQLPLSARETQVLEGLLAGQNNRQLASQLQISEKTVSHYKVSALKKLGTNSIATLAAMPSKPWRDGTRAHLQ